MTERGESSRAVEDDCVDKHIVFTEPIVPVVPIQPLVTDQEEDPEEDYERGNAEPVIGGVTRFYSEDEEDEVEETDAEEEDEPAEYADGMGTTASDIIEELTARNDELEDRVRQIEEENQTHQELEDGYKDVAYQLGDEVRELKAQLQEYEHSAQLNGPLLHKMVDRNAKLREEKDQAKLSLAELQVRHEVMKAEFNREIAERVRISEALIRSARRVEQLEAEVRSSAARIDTASFALDTAFGRMRSRIQRYPREDYLDRRVISRRVVDTIARREHLEAIRRSDQ